MVNSMNKLSQNVYKRGLGRAESKLKLWRSAGLMLTYKCPAACEFCYYNCGPDKAGLMAIDTALIAWQSLMSLAGEGAKVHITGGEAFLYFDHLAQLVKQAHQQGLGGFDMVETNGFWATDRKVVANRLKQLDEAGMGRLKVSWDPFHAEFVDIERVRLLAQTASEVLGPKRVLVRWEKYLREPVKMCGIGADGRLEQYRRAWNDYPCRFTGRASGTIAELFADKGAESLRGECCKRAFLSARGVHIDPDGNVFSGVCSGIVVGNVNESDLETMWQRFNPLEVGFIGCLFENGPAGMLSEAVELGFKKKAYYADKCHLCSKLRQFFFDIGRYKPIIGPPGFYRGA